MVTTPVSTFPFEVRNTIDHSPASEIGVVTPGSARILKNAQKRRLNTKTKPASEPPYLIVPPRSLLCPSACDCKNRKRTNVSTRVTRASPVTITKNRTSFKCLRSPSVRSVISFPSAASSGVTGGVSEGFGRSGRLWKTDAIGTGGFRRTAITDTEFVDEARQAVEVGTFSVNLASGEVSFANGAEVPKSVE